MRRISSLGIALLVLAAVATPATADPNLVLSSSDDLNNLVLGQDVHFDVTLQGVPVNTEFITFLLTEVRYDANLLEPMPPVLTPGSILDTPGKVTNFVANSSVADGVLDGRFREFPVTTSGTIGLNGLYYSFTLKAEAVGTGSIGFFFNPNDLPGTTSYASNLTPGAFFAPIPFNGPLAFNIAVPEPSSLALIGVGGVAMVALGRRRRRGRTSSKMG